VVGLFLWLPLIENYTTLVIMQIFQNIKLSAAFKEGKFVENKKRYQLQKSGTILISIARQMITEIMVIHR
jgi:hypothetical protein